MLRFGGLTGGILKVDWGGRPAFEWGGSRVEMEKGKRGHAGGWGLLDGGLGVILGYRVKARHGRERGAN
jgi:hypothetical protein